MESSPLTSIHQTQHLVLFELFADQELLGPSPRPGEGPTAALEQWVSNSGCCMLVKIGPQDDLEAFVDLFKHAVEILG